MKKIFCLIFIGVVMPVLAQGAEQNSRATLDQLREMIRVLTEQVRVLQVQVLARSSGVVPQASSYGIVVETVPVTEAARRTLDRLEIPLPPMPPEVPQIQSVRPQVSVMSQKGNQTWIIGSDFAITWEVSGFGKPSLNSRDVEVVLYDADGVNPRGFLCRQCPTGMIGLYGNEGSVTGRVGVLSTEERKLAKIQPGYYRIQVRLVSDSLVSAMSDGVVSVLAPSNSQNLAPSIVGVLYQTPVAALRTTVFTVEAYDPDGATLRYKMDPGDGTLGGGFLNGAASSDSFAGRFVYQYRLPGTYEVVFFVSDERGALAKASQYITVQ